jgi:hypothetical protein
MRESEIEAYFKWSIEMVGGTTYKFTSPSHRGVADRIACLPNGKVIMVELKTKGGRLSPLQKIFAADMKKLNVPYECLWSKEMVDEFISRISATFV